MDTQRKDAVLDRAAEPVAPFRAPYAGADEEIAACFLAVPPPDPETEARIDAKMTQLKALQTRISALLGQRDAAQEKQLASLVKTYSAMKPKDAARIFDSLSDQVLVPVAAEMKSDVLAPVLAAMNPEQAQKLTVRLANKLTLPDTNSTAQAAALTSTQVVDPTTQWT